MITSCNRRRLPVIAAGLLTAVVVAGCGNGLVTSDPGADPSMTSPPPATPSASASASASGATPSATPSTTPPSSPTASPSTGAPSTSRPSAGDPPAAPPKTSPSIPPSASAGETGRTSTTCRLADLSVGVRASAGGGAAGSNYVLLTFRNRSGSSCTLYGYPGVSFVGHRNGTQLGVPAVRDQAATPSTVKLAAGATTTALLRIVNAGSYDAQQCAPTTADGFRVYAPGSRTSAYVPFSTQACQRDPGGSKQLTVSPVGTAG